MPPPTIYFIKEKAWPELDVDAIDDEEYRGQAIVLVRNVPPEVSAHMLGSWLSAGLDDDDPDVAAARAQLEHMMVVRERVDKAIMELPNAKIAAGPVTAKEHLTLKTKKAQLLGNQRKELDDDIAELQGKFDALKLSREATQDPSYSLRLAETLLPLKLNTWEVRFGDDAHAQRMAFIAARKYNWSLFLLAVHRENNTVLTGKGELRNLTEFHDEVNMRGVTVSRRMHGIGVYRFADERGFYSGHWRHGLRHGTGTEINQLGRFQGSYKNDWRQGSGTQVYSQGDVVRGSYGGSRHHAYESLIYGDEYFDGQLHGSGTARFVDGSTYEGDWRDGAPCGEGRYVSSSGVVLEGTLGSFSALEGYGTYSTGEVTRMGTWKGGLLHGEGVEMDALLGSYEGDWRRGEKEGHGSALSELVEGEYVGWWKSSLRWGRGTLRYGNISRDAERSKAKRAALAAEAKSRALASSGGSSFQAAAAEHEASKGSSSSSSSSEPGQAEAQLPSEAAAAAAAAQLKSQYSLMQGSTHPLLQYKGDFEYDGSWIGSLPRAGGIFKRCHGHAEPNLHRLAFTSSGRNVMLPGGFSDLDQREERAVAQRAQLYHDSVREALQYRLLKEADNFKTFAFWKHQADAVMPEFKEKTRRGRAILDVFKEAVKKRDKKFKHEGEADDETPSSVSDSVVMAKLAQKERNESQLAKDVDVRDNLMV